MTEKTQVEQPVSIDQVYSQINAKISELWNSEDDKINEKQRLLRANPQLRKVITEITDVLFRSANKKRSADLIYDILSQHPLDRSQSHYLFKLLWLTSILIRPFYWLVVPILRLQVISEVKLFIAVSYQASILGPIITSYKKLGIGVCVNLIGEHALGEMAADDYCDTMTKIITQARTKSVSVKPSSMYSQLSSYNRQESIHGLQERLSDLIKTAEANDVELAVDMENYDSCTPVYGAILAILKAPEFDSAKISVALQAYLPEATEWCNTLIDESRNRVDRGGAPLKIRLVKGANLGEERVTASLNGWNSAPFHTKEETDRHFKTLCEGLLDSKNNGYVICSIASHNVFDVAFSIYVAQKNESSERLCFEYLNGMKPGLGKALAGLGYNVSLYLPVVNEGQMSYVLAYLTRRFDELCGQQEQAFMPLSLADSPNDKWRSHRTELPPHVSNYPPIDWTQRAWEKSFKNSADKKCSPIVSIINSRKTSAKNTVVGMSPFNPKEALYEWSPLDNEKIPTLIKCAVDSQKSWKSDQFMDRKKAILTLMKRLIENRGEAMRVVSEDSGKSLFEADVEVCESIDFCHYYSQWAAQWHRNDAINLTPKGVTLVLGPFNFPLAIPLGNIAMALLMGNSVIFKPAPETVRVGEWLANQFWAAGVSKKDLQFVCCNDETAQKIATHSKIRNVQMTGSTKTALHLLRHQPVPALVAETGGKNSIIVTSMADRELAIEGIVKSAFSFSGQKCSAASLIILENEVYNDVHFKRQLLDAISSLQINTSVDSRGTVSPLIRPPEMTLKRGLSSLDKGEEWALRPQQHKKNPHIWSPGVKWGVKRKSFMHQTELFGPVIGVMSAKNLDHAISLANDTPYGLSAGLFSLDTVEKNRWLQKIQAGNLYINKSITGATVSRQPFGGCKASSVGVGLKAGGPFYCLSFAKVKENFIPSVGVRWVESTTHFPMTYLNSDSAVMELWKKSRDNYLFWFKQMTGAHDLHQVLGEENQRYWVKRSGKITLRLTDNESELDVARLIMLGILCDVELNISVENATSVHGLFLQDDWLRFRSRVRIIEENNNQLANRILDKHITRIRYLSQAPLGILKACANTGAYCQVQSLTGIGQVELPFFLREISLSARYDRYGHISEDFMTINFS